MEGRVLNKELDNAEKTQQVNEQIETISEREGQYLTFFIEQQSFGIPIADVVQIVGMQEITPIPEFPAYAKGIINLRGSIIPLIDVRLRFQKPEREYDSRTCIIVADINTSGVGFIVDAVDAVTDIAEENISPPPSFSSNVSDSYLTGIAKQEGRVILLLNSEKVLSEDVASVLTDTK